MDVVCNEIFSLLVIWSFSGVVCGYKLRIFRVSLLGLGVRGFSVLDHVICSVMLITVWKIGGAKLAERLSEMGGELCNSFRRCSTW